MILKPKNDYFDGILKVHCLFNFKPESTHFWCVTSKSVNKCQVSKLDVSKNGSYVWCHFGISEIGESTQNWDRYLVWGFYLVPVFFTLHLFFGCSSCFFDFTKTQIWKVRITQLFPIFSSCRLDISLWQTLRVLRAHRCLSNKSSVTSKSWIFLIE